MPSSYVIGEHFEAFIKLQVSQGRYASASEVVRKVVRDGLRALEDREKLRALKLQALRDDIQRGADSGPGIPPKQVFADVRKRVAATGTRRAAGPRTIRCVRFVSDMSGAVAPSTYPTFNFSLGSIPRCSEPAVVSSQGTSFLQQCRRRVQRKHQRRRHLHHACSSWSLQLHQACGPLQDSTQRRPGVTPRVRHQPLRRTLPHHRPTLHAALRP